MKVIYTDEVLRDLDEILTFIASNHPSITAAFQQRLRSIERRIGKWPMIAEEVIQRPGLRVAPFIRYPYKSSTGSRAELWKYSTSVTPPGTGERGQRFCFTHVARLRLFRTGAVGGLHSFGQVPGQPLFRAIERGRAAGIHRAGRIAAAAADLVLPAGGDRSAARQHGSDCVLRAALHDGDLLLPAGAAVGGSLGRGPLVPGDTAVWLFAGLLRVGRAPVRPADARRRTDRGRRRPALDRPWRSPRLQGPADRAHARLRLRARPDGSDLQDLRNTRRILDRDVLGVRRAGVVRRRAAGDRRLPAAVRGAAAR